MYWLSGRSFGAHIREAATTVVEFLSREVDGPFLEGAVSRTKCRETTKIPNPDANSTRSMGWLVGRGAKLSRTMMAALIQEVGCPAFVHLGMDGSPRSSFKGRPLIAYERLSSYCHSHGVNVVT